VLYATVYDRTHLLEQEAGKKSHVLTKPLDFHAMNWVMRSVPN